MKAYTYQADVYCEDCGLDICRRLTAEDKAPAHPFDESTYDSDEFPKGPYEESECESDCPQHCGGGSDCVNALEVDLGYKVGAWLENPLTAAGVHYVVEAVREGTGCLAAFWADVYSEEIKAEGGE